MTDQNNQPNDADNANTDHVNTDHEPDRKLLEMLVCPLTKTSLHYDRKTQELVSKAAKLAYPVRNGVPIMLPDEARKLTD